jgi:ppGpp synthetase/RelA/SpoT-type nucleotidyltranferase
VTDIEAARKLWLIEYPQFQEFASHLGDVLKGEVQRAGIRAQVESRAKALHSLVRKLIRKPEHTYESLFDKAGVRVVVRYKHEIRPVLEIARELFERGDPENMVDRMKPDTFGYLSVHADIRLKPNDSLIAKFPSDKFTAEIQVRTLAQHLWAEMAHDTVYKSSELVRPLNALLQRRIYILAGVVELADEEFDRIDHEMPTVPEFQLLKSLERNYYKLTVRRSDPELSLDVIRLLMPLYHQGPGEIASHLDQVFNENQAVLHDVYSKVEDLPKQSAFLFQPEALMIFDLLQTERLSVRDRWIPAYPFEELERIANAFGISFD